MKGIKHTGILLLLQLFVFHCLSQTRAIDNLKKNIQTAVSKEEKVKAIFSLCDLGYTLHPDTLMYYAQQAKELATVLGNKHDEVLAMYYQSWALTTMGLLDSSINLSNFCLDILTTKVNDPALQGNFYNRKSGAYIRKNMYKESIDLAYQVIAIGEKNNNDLLQVKGKILIGWAYLEMGQHKESLEWHLKALHSSADSTIVARDATILFGNLALNYYNLGKEDSAFFYINKGIAYARKYESLFALSNCLAIESQLFVKTNQAKLAEPILKEVINIRKMIGDPYYIASDMSQLGLYYAHYGEPEKGIAICMEGIALAKKYKLDTKLSFLYMSLADNYKAMGDTIKYASVLEDIIVLKDSIYEKNSAKSLAEMQIKFDLQKKETLIIQQKLDISRKNYLFYGSLIVLFFAALSSWLIFREYKRRQKIKMLQMQEEEKILSAIAVTKAEENERKRIAADLHDNLGAYAAAIVSNIDQLNLQNSVPLQELKINSQSIVSQLNDTIWVLKKDNLSLTAISDRIKIFIQRIQPSYPKINIDVVERISTDLLMLPTHAFHLFKITQEAIINALKHSNSKNVMVYVESDKLWRITISDEGDGIAVQQMRMSKGNGLMNMKARSKEAGWKIEWLQNEPAGTNVVISPTTN